jgi:hypothetical protein
MNKVTAYEILKALAARHREDYFMTEVKDGPTQFGTHFRMDAVAIKKSWANPCVTCYEVKVNRQDFLRDEKWPVYLGYCNRFAFVCAEGLIQKEELAPEIGLYWYRGEGKPFKYIRHPVYRTVDIPSDFYMYIIMCKIQSDRFPFFSDKEGYFRECIENKRTAADLGHKLSHKIAEELWDMGRKVSRLESDLENANETIELQEKVTKLLNDHGITWARWSDTKTWYDALERYLNSGMKGNDLQIRKAIEHAEGTLSYLKMIGGGEK